MAARPATGFDLGPLSWVKTEIDHSLGQARENLEKIVAAPGDRAPVKYILTHLHQATGALAMVGLGAATRYNEELERLVSSIETCDDGEIGTRVPAAKRAIALLSAYLDSLMAGEPDRPMSLLPAYLALNRARGAADATEGDLFHPDLSTELAAPAQPAAPVDGAVLAKALQHQRAQYQQGLLKALRGGNAAEAFRQLQAAVAAIESLQEATPNRPFWRAATAFFDALSLDGLALDAGAKPLLAKVDQQVKQLIEGSAKVPERLFRDLLLQVGRSRPVSPRIAELKAAYRLDELLATPPSSLGEAPDEAISALVRELRELTGQQKDTWLKYTSGNRAALEPFGKQALALADRAALLPRRDLQQVFVKLADVAPMLKTRAIPPSESQALEVATALLFIESALDNYFRLGSDFERQSRTVSDRLKAAMAGESVPPMDTIEGGILDEMTRRAQERLLVFQVGQEVQVNLQGIEQALDAFFRDAAKREELKGLPAQFAQVQGALMIMELEAAAGLNAAVSARVQQFAEGTLDGTGEAAEMVAEGLSALGLYITAIQQGAARPADVLQPALVRFGLAQSPDRIAEEALRRTGTVSPLDLDVQKQKVQALYEDWKEAPGEEVKEKLERAVDGLKRDAVVLADAEVARQSEEALAALHEASDATQTGVFQAIQELAPEKPPETPPAQVVQLVDAPGAEIDRELLEIFLEEATDVAATIAEHLATCRHAPHDRESLTTIRRGFHTLKGSGRMVGLTDLGEVAWQCEQVMNKWLKDEKPATPGLLDFVELARKSFSGWIDSLKSGADTPIDGTEIARCAEHLKSGEAAVPVAPLAPMPEEPSAPAVPVQPEPAATPAPAGLTFESLDLQPAAAAPPAEPSPAPAAPAEFDFSLFATGAPAAGERAAEPAEEAEPDVVVGTVSLSPALFSIYVGEAEQHAATLDREMSAIELDPMHPVSHEFMRAAHTLTSSSRTTGFSVLADVAHALEKWLADAIDYPPEFTPARIAATRRAVDGVIAMVRSIAGRALPLGRDDLVDDLRLLREGLQESRRTGEGTHLRMPGLRRDAVASPPEIPEAAPAPVVELVPEPAPPEPAPPEPAPPEPAPPEPAPPEPAPLEPAPPEPAPPEPAPVELGSAGPTPVEHAAISTAPVLEPPPVPEQATTAEETRPFEAGKDQRKIKDDVDRDLLPIFLDEARELVPAVSDGLRRWKANPADASPAADLRRHLHTLKGSARMTGLMRLGELAHVLETRVVDMGSQPRPAEKDFEEAEERIDRFSVALERLSRGEDMQDVVPVEVPVSAVFEQQKDKPTPLAVIAAAAETMAQQQALPPELREVRAALLRVNADLVDQFVNEAGELSIARSRIEGEMATFRRALADLSENVSRMRVQLREIEIASEGQMQSRIKERDEHGASFDPLEFDRFTRMQELTRFLAESLGDVITLQQGLQKNIDETELAILQQARLNRELQQGLMGVRLVPLGNLADRFYRVVRQTAKDVNKKANLELKGIRTELDRSVLEKITAPFEHLLRNAVAHGIEPPAERAAAGKPEIGEISIDAVQRGNEVVLTVSDDGRGLDLARIRDKAVSLGLMEAGDELPDPALSQFIFWPGFSTATEVTQVAGRGVGMDVVKNEIVSLGGRVELASTPGRGTTFTITLPLTLAVSQAVMLRAGDRLFAIPSVMIEQVQEYKAQPYAELVARGEIAWKDNRYPLRSLLSLLGEPDTPVPARQIPVLLLKSGVQRAAVRVDEIIGNREIVVKTIGPQLARLAGIAGATVLGNGQVVLILNPVNLVYREASAAESIAAAVAAKAAAAPAPVVAKAVPLVMVVDDSLTVRKITSRMLAREGYEFVTAKDGVDALQQLQDVRPDVILLDVEMPRMDGFEFARNVRADEATRAIPIIMITSRTADKHRSHAIELGVNEYMGKPYQEEQLLSLIARYARHGEPAPAGA
ncbi:MAG: Hpt domain-containing protein [Burkholderiales bacterium]|nr:Hpt domain-containing protein [Burkholderiales bacterium]